ncbi:MAG: CoA transferase [Acidobacteriota bacterium]|nr:CoA transferase [Acidobacteriota bacterium]
MNDSAPLAGLTVLDLSRVLSGPYCTMLLADMGARVIKVEQPGRGDDTRHWGPPFVGRESAYFLSVNRNKESLTLDFKQPGARRVLDALLERADILVENFRVGTLARVGLGYDDLRVRHPRLVYCSITGYGQTGPRASEAGYDAVTQAEGGLMSITGPEGGDPFRLGVAIADIVAGMYAAQGVLLALLARHRTGRGQLVDIAMLDAVASLLTYQASSYFAVGVPGGRLGNRHPSIAPYDTFATADGVLVLAVGNDDQWQRFCRVAAQPALAADLQYATNALRVTNIAPLAAHLTRVIALRTTAEWLTDLREAGVPAGSVRDIGETLADPQLHARGMIERVDHEAQKALRLLGIPVKLSDTPGSVRTPPPMLGEHSASVLRELGFDDNEVARLRDEGVI